MNGTSRRLGEPVAQTNGLSTFYRFSSYGGNLTSSQQPSLLGPWQLALVPCMHGGHLLRFPRAPFAALSSVYSEHIPVS